MGLLSIGSTVTTPRSVVGPLPMDEGDDVDSLENGKIKEYETESSPRSKSPTEMDTDG